ncbi:MAG: homoserine O-acetyltransferase [Saprospiraceae bacterium]|nr:homoserine O-acetyltransferase [Saprospiraceae bacterium]
MKIYRYQHPFHLESGETLPEIEVGYTTYGQLNSQGDNVVWVCHALTANSDPQEWWPGLIGEGKLYDPEKYFIVCANILGSCYGSTNPDSINPVTGMRYGKDFPLVTIRDIVKSLILLRIHLGIDSIYIATGGSMGGQQALEWAIMEPTLIQNLIVIGTNAKHSPWGVAFNEAQRMALEADPTLYSDEADGGMKGLEAARAVAMLSYRNYQAYHLTQMEEGEKLDGFKASSYQRYQGLKLRKRFRPLSYLILSKGMDSHDLGRGRGGYAQALSIIRAHTLVFGIASDFLFPISEQEEISKNIKGAVLEVIDSPFGHDGFLIEFAQITHKVHEFLDHKLG